MNENKAIFEVVRNGKGEVEEVIYKYLNTESVMSCLVEMLTAKRDEYCGDTDTDFHGWYYTDDEIEAYAYYLVSSYNEEMKKYLHQKDLRLNGNFGNLEHDYNYYKCGAVTGVYDTKNFGGDKYSLTECIARLDSGEKSNEADTDREALTDWFWNTFGTYNIVYRFGDHLNSAFEDFCYCEGIDIY